MLLAEIFSQCAINFKGSKTTTTNIFAESLILHLEHIQKKYKSQLVSLLILLTWHSVLHKKFEPTHDKTYKTAGAPREDSDQPGHPPNLISLCFALNG